MAEAASGLFLRAAEPGDGAALAALSIEVWLGTYLRRGVSSFFADYVLEAFTAERFRQLIGEEGERLIVSQNAEGIDGYIRLTNGCRPPEGPGSAVEIATLYVQPRHHGRGVGRALLGSGLQICADWGAAAPWLTTNADNLPAIRFYQSEGFEITGRTHFRIGAEAYPNEILVYRPAG
ncbi:GNAT family N-acetyltransferase [Cribrihabitans pelagius]|uniref:GNAT family N-acetyltransferase n=1 Tax=Cribrihabitans pelagius TaxID=1765746 RepID=UPI003B5A7C52